jgi:hypothetical protein
MFYPSLEPLRDSEDRALIERLDEKLANLFVSDRRRIAPSFMSRELGIPLNDAARLLLKAADLGVGEVVYEVLCSECGSTVRDYSKLADVPLEASADCDTCGEEYAASAEGIWVAFRITSEPTKKA